MIVFRALFLRLESRRRWIDNAFGNWEKAEERRFSAVHERIRFITHKGKQILLTDFSNCSANTVERIARSIPECVTAQPRGSVLLLTDFTKASFDSDAIRAIKESAVFNKAFIKKSAWIGAENLPKDFEQNLKDFSRRQFPVFKSLDEALSWLIED